MPPVVEVRLLEELRAYLVARGLVRIPRVAGPLPPMWLEPRNGVPAPGEGTTVEAGDMVTGAYLQSGPPPAPYESFQRQDMAEIWIRSRTATDAHDFEKALRRELIDKRAWQMNGMLVIETELWRGLQMVASDAQGFTYNLSYWFQYYA